MSDSTLTAQSLMDLADADTGFQPLPPAIYDAEVTQADAVRTKDDTRDMLKIAFRIASGEYTGRTLYLYLVVDPDKGGLLKMFFERMGSLGFGRDYFLNHPYAGLDANGRSQFGDLLRTTAPLMAGRTAGLDVAPDTYQGKPSNKIKDVVPPLIPQEPVAPPVLPSADSLPGGLDVFAPAPVPNPAPAADGAVIAPPVSPF